MADGRTILGSPGLRIRRTGAILASSRTLVFGNNWNFSNSRPRGRNGRRDWLDSKGTASSFDEGLTL